MNSRRTVANKVPTVRQNIVTGQTTVSSFFGKFNFLSVEIYRPRELSVMKLTIPDPYQLGQAKEKRIGFKKFRLKIMSLLWKIMSLFLRITWTFHTQLIRVNDIPFNLNMDEIGRQVIYWYRRFILWGVFLPILYNECFHIEMVKRSMNPFHDNQILGNLFYDRIVYMFACLSLQEAKHEK